MAWPGQDGPLGRLLLPVPLYADDLCIRMAEVRPVAMPRVPDGGRNACPLRGLQRPSRRL